MKPTAQIKSVKPLVRVKEMETKSMTGDYYYDEDAIYDEALSYDGVYMYLPFKPTVKIKTIKPYVH